MHFYEDNRDLLFDLSKDIGERNDLAERQPADAARLRQQLDNYLAAVNAQLPTPNPNYDPNKPVNPAGKKGGKGDKPRKKPLQ